MALKIKKDGLYLLTGKTLSKRLAAQIAQALPCPIAGYGSMVTWLEERVFAAMCSRYRRRCLVKNAFAGTLSEEHNVCLGCRIGERVAAGKRFEPPAGVVFVSRDELLARINERQGESHD
jgi:collagenase-like PrtC family protease